MFPISTMFSIWMFTELDIWNEKVIKDYQMLDLNTNHNYTANGSTTAAEVGDVTALLYTF